MEIMRVTSTATDEAVTAFEPFFPSVEIGPSLGEPFRFTLEAHTSGDLGLIEYSLDGREIHASGDGSGFMVTQVDIDGELVNGRDIIDASQPFLYPDLCSTVLHRARARILNLNVEAVNRFAQVDLGNDRFQVAKLGIAPLSAERGLMWSSVSKLASERIRDGSADLPLVAATLSDLLIATFLNTFPTTWSDARQRGDGAKAVRTAVRRARAFIDENFRKPVTSADIAEAARMSLSGLLAAFRRELGFTPFEYLRRVRLTDARRALLNTDSGDTGAVARSASAAGFTHPSRFAAAYRTEFGELPSRTLRH